MTPNVFSYVTSELSQDAMLCCLLAWADDGHREAGPALHDLGREFVSSLLRRRMDAVPERFETVRVETQYGGIDVLCTVNERIALLIEDKVSTVAHSDQLAR